jgi:5-amino-6-(5-phosphoribosylamino)uracil reductase
MNRPKTTVILAMSADGKIASCDRSSARFSSDVDRAHLEKQISLTDAVLFGSGTLRAYQTTMPISNPQLILDRKAQKKPLQPIHIVGSSSGCLNPQWRFFKQNVPRWLITTHPGAKAWRDGKQKGFERILVAEVGNGGKREIRTEGEKSDRVNPGQMIDWIDAFAQLKKLGIEKLGILGGGELIASLLAMDLIDEFWLTVCPVILGGASSPTPVEGIGFTPQQTRSLELLSSQQIEQEIFLHYRLKH